jgi:hypothetical protein
MDNARRAKEQLKRDFPNAQVGFRSNPKGSGIALAVRVRTEEEKAEIPNEVLGVTVICQIIVPAHKQSE